MINLIIIGISLILLGGCLIIAYLIIKYPNLFKSKKKYSVTVDNPEAIDAIIKLIPDLTNIEKEYLLGVLFGRSIRIQKSITPSGETWLEMAGVLPHLEEPEEEEINSAVG